MTRSVKIKQPENGEEIALEIIAEHIVELSRIGQKLQTSRMKQDTIVLLLHDFSGVSKTQIRAILHALPQLEQKYLKPKPTKK